MLLKISVICKIVGNDREFKYCVYCRLFRIFFCFIYIVYHTSLTSFYVSVSIHSSVIKVRTSKTVLIAYLTNYQYISLIVLVRSMRMGVLVYLLVFLTSSFTYVPIYLFFYNSLITFIHWMGMTEVAAMRAWHILR